MLHSILIVVVTFIMVVIWMSKFSDLEKNYDSWLKRSFGNYAWFMIAKFLPVMLLFRAVDMAGHLEIIYNSL